MDHSYKTFKRPLNNLICSDDDKTPDEKKLDKQAIDDLLKYGAYDIFREGQDEGDQYDEEDIDKILEVSLKNFCLPSLLLISSSLSFFLRKIEILCHDKARPN